MQTIYKRGFTLIELLVVIAIIGILASVILVSVNSARNKGNDAAVKSNLDGIRTQAEIYYDNQSPTSYAGLCMSSPVSQAVQSAGSAGGGAGVCNDSATAWAAQAPLRAGGYWCVDSTGKSSTSTTALVQGGNTVCP
jgi:prepilin-type N-terminal cleavage/methylation domain-containing protein